MSLSRNSFSIFSRLSPSESARIRLPSVSVGIIGVGPLAIIFNLPKRFQLADSDTAPVISIDEVNRRNRAASKDT